MKEIILVTFSYPPQVGINVRRWVKFTKYLARMNYKIHVVTIDFKHNEKNQNWLKDIDHENIIVHRVKSPYPTWLLKNSNRSFIEKVFGKIFRDYIQKYLYPLCYSQGWQKELIPYVRNLIQNRDIKNVIVNTPPHLISYYISVLKVENPKINFIVDQRDPWNTMIRHQYGTYIKSFKTKEKLLYMENYILSRADKVVVVSKEMKEDIIKAYDFSKDKTHVISNGYDVEDYVNYKSDEKKELNQIKLVYAGSFGAEKRNLAIKLILKSLTELNDSFLNDNLTIDIYSTANDSFFFDNSVSKELYNKVICLKKTIVQTELFKQIKNCTYCLSINGPYDSKAMGTKIYDYVQLNKKVVHISNGGELYELLDNGSNFVSDYNIDNMKKMLLEIKEDYLNDTYSKTDHTQFNNFNIEYLAKEYEKLLI